MTIRPSMIDLEPQSFLEWRESLEKEDIQECGSVVKRGYGELRRMYAAYRNFQYSDPVVFERQKLLAEARGE